MIVFFLSSRDGKTGTARGISTPIREVKESHSTGVGGISRIICSSRDEMSCRGYILGLEDTNGRVSPGSPVNGSRGECILSDKI